MKCLWYSYTGFDKVRSVRNGNDSICYTYGYDHHEHYDEFDLINMNGQL